MEEESSPPLSKDPTAPDVQFIDLVEKAPEYAPKVDRTRVAGRRALTFSASVQYAAGDGP